MQLTSDALTRDHSISLRYTKDGENISPPLRWTDVPGETRELALVFENVTPQTEEPFVQWLVYKISPELPGLPEGFKHMAEPGEPAHALQGKNSLGNVGYDGPQGTVGRRFRYRFRLFALDEPLDVAPGLDKAPLLEAMDNHVIDTAELDASYERPR